MATVFLLSFARKYVGRYLGRGIINMLLVFFAVLTLNFVLPRPTHLIGALGVANHK